MADSPGIAVNVRDGILHKVTANRVGHYNLVFVSHVT